MKRNMRMACALLLVVILTALLASCEEAGRGGAKVEIKTDANGKCAVYNTAEEYFSDVAYWDGTTVSFSDGSSVKLEVGEVLLVQDKDGNTIDQYVGAAPADAPLAVQPEVLRDMEEDFTTLLVYSSKEEFYANRPMWNGTLLNFDGTNRVVLNGDMFAAVDRDGNELCRYGKPAQEATSGGEVKEIVVQDDLTVIRLEGRGRQVSFMDQKGRHLYFIWNADVESEREDFKKYCITTTYAVVVNGAGQIIEDYYLAPPVAEDRLPSYVKHVFTEGFKTVVVLADEVYENIQESGSLYVENCPSEDERKSFSPEQVKKDFEGVYAVTAGLQFGSRAVFFDGTSVEITGGKVVFVPEYEYTDTHTSRDYWYSDTELENPMVTTFVDDYYTKRNDGIMDGQPEDLKLYTRILLKKDAIWDMDASQIRVEGNKIIFPCGTEVVSQCDMVIIICNDSAYNPADPICIDLDYYQDVDAWCNDLDEIDQYNLGRNEGLFYQMIFGEEAML